MLKQSKRATGAPTPTALCAQNSQEVVVVVVEEEEEEEEECLTSRHTRV